MKCEKFEQSTRHKRISKKTPDLLIHHEHGVTFVEVVSATGPDEFSDKRGEVDLCRMVSPGLYDEGLFLHLSYDTVEIDEWNIKRDRTAPALIDPLSKAVGNSVLEQILSIALREPDKYRDWHAEIEIRGRKLEAFVHRFLDEPGQIHMGHTTCAVGFIKNASKGGHIEDHLKADRNRVIEKVKKYTPDALGNIPLIVALFSHDAWTHEEAAKIAYGTTHPAVSFVASPDSGDLLPVSTREILLPDGIWCDLCGNHRRHLAAIWIFNSWDTANNLPLLAINPFLEDKDFEKAIPKRMRDVSIVCRQRAIRAGHT